MMSAVLVVALVAPALRDPGWRRRLAAAESGLFALLAVAMVVDVAGEDDYLNDGTSRWAAYDAHGISVAAVLSSLLGCVLAGAAVRRAGLVRWIPAAASVVVLLNYLALASMTN